MLPQTSSEDPNQHLKHFLKLVDSLDLDGENKERTRMCLFQFSLRDQASNWLERLPARSITTWEDLTTRFLAQFSPPGRTAQLHNDIMIFQQHHGESLSEAWTRFKDLLKKVPHHGFDLWLKVQIFYDHVNPVTRRTIDQSTGSKLRDRNSKESWALLEDLALYDNESWNNLRDFSKRVKATTLPQDVPSTSDRRLIELENQVQHLMEAHLAPKQPTQVNKIITSCKICSGPHDTQYCMEDPEQDFVEYATSLPTKREISDARLSKFEADFKQQQSEMTKKTDTVLKAITDRMAGVRIKSLLEVTAINQLQTGMGIGMQQPKEPEPTLEDEFQDLHLNLPVLEVLAHALIYNVILDKYVESLELGKNGSAFVQGEVSAKMKDPGLLTLPCRLGNSKPFDILADLGLCAIESRFRGNATTKKTQKNLLKQQYENFAASSTEVIEQTYERLQKLISQLEMH
ncbi:MAK10-like protein, partial [Tanacetum coccineum]